MNRYNRVFVTGATGLLGKEIVKTLVQNGYSVQALKRPKSKVENSNHSVSWVEGDLNDFTELIPSISTNEVVIHCAAKVNFNPKRANETIDFNTKVTEEMVNFCLRENKVLVHISSVASMSSSNQEVITEDSQFDFQGIQTAYAKSKYFSEMEVWRGINEGLKAVILNPSVLLGIPAKWSKSSGNFWNMIDQGLKYYPTGSTGFVDATDVAQVAIQLLESDCRGQRFILNSEHISFKDFFSQIAHQIGKKAPSKPLTKGRSKWALALSSLASLFGFHSPLSKPLLQTVSSDISYSNQKIKDYLHIEFTSVQDSILRVSEQFIEDRGGN